ERKMANVNRRTSPTCKRPHLLILRIASTLDIDLRNSIVESANIFRRKFNVRRSEVLIESVEFCRAWNRHNPRPLSQNPGECDLRRRDFLLLGKFSNQIDNRLI